MNIKIFEFEGKEIQVMLDDNNDPWWIANEVCKVLEIKNPRDAIAKLEDDEKGVVNTDTLGGKQDVNIINEPGLYNLVMVSRTPAAKRFKRCVSHDILPSIRKTGSYGDPIAKLQTPEGVEALLKIVQKKIELEKQIEEDAPKVNLYNQLMASDGNIDVGAMAILLGTGRNRLFEWMRNEGYLRENNRPYQQYVDRGLLDAFENVLKNGKPYIQTVVTPKGQEYLLNKWERYWGVN
jgi:anti-repressor protein